ncbi:hypothetical protein GCM10010168_84730 [Actinoplanes ianthinogenes]|uniref:DUF4870 domain-containing protein n=1 Tax=Actinoplanes ianthinogenes TaxID=122358 RepID=A0ABM7M037_9ACTN|nr:DUF4870 domain-containing protein [Actinoplanes ianthinogenes]BCJ44953.1 hypothetical protein Aiant_56100 [Actinoplanes ianthinogenes]GGR52772.1 hypothetical protein GCM10010168_84730 [Actinoplanes ianthinogenes]
MTEPPRPPGDGYPTSPGAPYTPPPGPGYPPPPPYGPPSGGYHPGYPPPLSSEDRTWILVAHLGGAAGAFLGGGLTGWVAPLVSLLARGEQSPAVRAESVKALNFQILWTIIAVIGYATFCFGIGVAIAGIAWLFATIAGGIAGAKAANNEPFRYPASGKFLR